ncbi:hypothetical protein JMJ35_003603 [Cladonia borealis]|uniref:AB hydrolase-1 domain-containing protein n=1 Tax=Cladonia borealis TaxID=184061 RepID=A0AA39UBX9_9LECA|nr:hypothetical protein JMJ35_003603 [Cladonia borealis]
MTSESLPKTQDRQAWIQQSDPEIRIFYTECRPRSGKPKGTILLIHGFPETSYQFRHVIVPLSRAGYHVLAPDYRGHGYSSKPPSGYTKDILAQDLYKLVTEHVGIKDKIHLVGHDIGGMIAHAYDAQFPEHVASINLGDTGFQAQTDIAVTLVTGKEKLYLKHFYDRLGQNQAAFTNEVVDFYTMQYSAAGALNAAFTTYRMLEEDAKMNREWREKNGKVGVRAMVMSGECVFMTAEALEMASEMYDNVEKGVIEGCGLYLAEENPEGFARKVLDFVEKE